MGFFLELRLFLNDRILMFMSASKHVLFALGADPTARDTGVIGYLASPVFLYPRT